MMKKLIAAVAIAAALPAQAAPQEPVWSLAKKEKPAVVETLRELVNVESGSRDKEGLDRLAALLGEKLTALGGKVSFYEPTEADTYRLFDTPKDVGKIVTATFQGTGKRKVMLLAHMDTVYQRGTLARRPFRVDGARAFGPGIADDKGGIAVILHTLAMLKAMNYRGYGTLTVVINGDEEISSPGGRNYIQRTGAEHEFVFSCEPTPAIKEPEIALATSGIGQATLTVRGKSSHAGVAPELGRNAIVELAHQILQTSDLSDAANRIKFNWTLANGGQTRNVIPELATASADVRVNRIADFDVIEKRFREKVATQRIADAKVEAGFERRRAPLVATDASRALAKRAQAIYAELGQKLAVDESGNGGGTDAAFAAASGKPAVAESFGLAGFGYHSSDEEYVELDSIEPRLYLLTRLIMDVSK
jgi:glutamate carboxypeptidase